VALSKKRRRTEGCDGAGPARDRPLELEGIMGNGAPPWAGGDGRGGGGKEAHQEGSRRLRAPDSSDPTHGPSSKKGEVKDWIARHVSNAGLDREGRSIRGSAGYPRSRD